MMVHQAIHYSYFLLHARIGEESGAAWGVTALGPVVGAATGIIAEGTVVAT